MALNEKRTHPYFSLYSTQSRRTIILLFPEFDVKKSHGVEILGKHHKNIQRSHNHAEDYVLKANKMIQGMRKAKSYMIEIYYFNAHYE